MERARLQLRGVQAQHAALDEQEAKRKLERRARDESRREEKWASREEERLAEEEARDRQRRQEQERRDRDQRETTLFLVEHGQIHNYHPPHGIVIPQRLKTQALFEIRRQTAAIPVDSNLFFRCLMIARGIRDEIFGPEIRRQQEEGRREEERHQETLRLLSEGTQYARQEIEGIRSLDGLTRLLVLRDVEKALQGQITGAESREDLENLIDGVIRRQMKGRDVCGPG